MRSCFLQLNCIIWGSLQHHAVCINVQVIYIQCLLIYSKCTDDKLEIFTVDIYTVHDWTKLLISVQVKPNKKTTWQHQNKQKYGQQCEWKNIYDCSHAMTWISLHTDDLMGAFSNYLKSYILAWTRTAPSRDFRWMDIPAFLKARPSLLSDLPDIKTLHKEISLLLYNLFPLK